MGYTDYEWALHSSIINHIHVTNNFVGKLVLYALKFLEIPLLSTFNRTHSQNNSAVFHAHTGIELWFRGKFTTETRFSVLSSPFIGFQLFLNGKRKWTEEYVKMRVISFSLVALSAHLHSLALLLAPLTSDNLLTLNQKPIKSCWNKRKQKNRTKNLFHFYEIKIILSFSWNNRILKNIAE